MPFSTLAGGIWCIQCG